MRAGQRRLPHRSSPRRRPTFQRVLVQPCRRSGLQRAPAHGFEHSPGPRCSSTPITSTVVARCRPTAAQLLSRPGPATTINDRVAAQRVADATPPAAVRWARRSPIGWAFLETRRQTTTRDRARRTRGSAPSAPIPATPAAGSATSPRRRPPRHDARAEDLDDHQNAGERHQCQNGGSALEWLAHRVAARSAADGLARISRCRRRCSSASPRSAGT